MSEKIVEKKASKRPARKFRGWLKRQKRVKGAVGKLARDAPGDTRWEGRTAASLEAHLKSLGVAPEVFAALYEARRMFEGRDE